MLGHAHGSEDATRRESSGKSDLQSELAQWKGVSATLSCARLRDWRERCESALGRAGYARRGSEGRYWRR